jgi:DNA repair protein RecO (recombination protein O)
MASRYRTRSGIVVRRNVTPAGDVILGLLTPEGKLRGVARGGVKGSRSPRLNLFQHLTVQTYEKPGNDLATLSEIMLEGALPGLSSPDVYPFAHFLCELADKLYQEEDFVGQAGFELFTGGLRGLVRHTDPDRITLLVSSCIETGDFENLTHFDAGQGGVTSARVARGLNIGEDAIEELGNIARGTVREVLEDELSDGAREGLWLALEAYLGVHVSILHAWGAVKLMRSSQPQVAA